MSKPVPRSRLNITYRTKIDGKPTKAKLPMRFLVLGDFTGHDRRLLSERPVHSVLVGMKLDSFMQELKVSAPIDDPALGEKLFGRLVGKVAGKLVSPLNETNAKGLMRFTGTGTVSGDFDSNGLGSFIGDVVISGEREVTFEESKNLTDQEIELSLFGKVEPTPKAPFGLTGTVGQRVRALPDARPGPTAYAEVKVKVKLFGAKAPENGGPIDLEGEVTSDLVPIELTIPIRSLNDFKPLHLAESVPEIRRLVLLHRLVLEARNYISSFPALREVVKKELAVTKEMITGKTPADKSTGKDPVAGKATQLGKLQAALCTRYPQLMVSRPDAAPVPPPDAAPMEPEVKTFLDKLITSSGMNPGDYSSDVALVGLVEPPQAPASTDSAAAAVPARRNLKFKDHDSTVKDPVRFANGLAALLANIDLFPIVKGQETIKIDTIRGLMLEVEALAIRIDKLVQEQLQKVVHSPSVVALETSWRSLDSLCSVVTSNQVIVDFIDTGKELLRTDFEDHSSYILNSALFRKVYVDEYDRYGGLPFGAMVGLYDFESSEEDIAWLQTMSRISQEAHCPFIAAASPRFFKVDSWEDLERKTDLEELLALPQFAPWETFRRTEAAAYIGLALPRYLLRSPYESRPESRQAVNFAEDIPRPEDYLWGSAAVLFAKNMLLSFQEYEWCQHIAGPIGGGLVQGLPVHMRKKHDQLELQPPVEIAIADYRELQFANAGFIPLIHNKGTADACFFSARSVKKAIEFDADVDTKNADLVCNLAYTLSITRIAHYVKRMVRDYIGSTADGAYIQSVLEAWLVDYVTTAVNPDDVTLRYYPFKAMRVSVEPKPGPFGWYKCVVSVLPHVQFQGMDVELRLEAALGGV